MLKSIIFYLQLIFLLVLIIGGLFWILNPEDPKYEPAIVTFAFVFEAILMILQRYCNKIEHFLYLISLRLRNGWLLTDPKFVGVELLTTRDLVNVPKQIQTLIDEILINEADQLIESKLVVHFYHEPMDLQNESILESNKLLLERGIRILWVHNSSNVDFEQCLKDTIAVKHLRLCCFKRMPEKLKRVPINFTVVSPSFQHRNLIFMRLPGDNTINFGVKIVDNSVLAKNFNQLALECLKSLKVKEVPACWVNAFNIC